MSSYLLANAAAQTGGRFDALALTYDRASRRAVASTGITAGWHCWEVGGGGGSVAAWLATQVGPTGHVLVTDIDPRWMCELTDHPTIELRHHDVVRDELPDTRFDLIHARLVLLHLPHRHLVLDRLIGCLRPGGWLVIEDFDCDRVRVLAAPSRSDQDLFTTVHRAFLDLLHAKGADPGWGRALPAALVEHGLRQVTGRTHAVVWRGGGREIQLHRVNMAQIAEQLVTSGLDARLLEDFLTLLDDPAFTVSSYPLVSALGRTPA